MDRRAFITAVGGSILAAPVGAKAQQPAMPVIGYLSQRSPTDSASIVAAFRQGLKEEGFVEGRMLLSNIAMPKGKSIACRR